MSRTARSTTRTAARWRAAVTGSPTALLAALAVYGAAVAAAPSAASLPPSAPVLAAMVQAADTTPPPVPTALEAAIGDRGVGLHWSHATAADRAGYQVFRSTSLPVPTSGTPINASLVTASAYLDSGRTNGTTYHYVVVTQDTSGNRSAASATVSGRPVAPAAPTGATIGWLQKASAALARAEAGGAAVDGRLYVFGGQYTGATQTLKSERYDPSTNTWTAIRDLPELITHAPVVVDGTTLWILGGYLGLNKKDSTDHVWRYDTKTDTYAPGPPLPAARGGGGAVLVGRQLHYFTGAVRRDLSGGPVTDHPEHWVLDVDSGTSWSTSTPVPNPRNHVGTVLLGGVVYLIGGQHQEAESHTPQTQVDAFDVATKTWRRVADLPVPRGHISASSFAVDGKILVLAGSVLGAQPSRTIYQYDPATDVWTTRTNLPEGLRSPVAELIQGKIVVSGGRASTGPTVKTWSGTVAASSDTTAPGAPTGLRATAGTGPSVSLEWTARTESDLAGYAVYRSATTPVPTSGTPLSGSTLLTTAAYVDRTVAAGASYSYAVVARDRSGNTSPASAPATVTVPTADGAGSWSTATALPADLLDAGGAAIGTKIYVVAGKTSAGPQRTLRIYDTVARTWSTGPLLPGSAVENPAVTVVDGRLHVMGGSTSAFSGAVSSAARYDPGTNTWTALPPMPAARAGAAAVTVGSTVWVVGGMSGGASLATTLRYDTVAKTWSAGPQLATARDNPGAAVVAGRIHAFGGRTRLANGTEVTPNLNTTEVLEAGGTAWHAAAPMPTGRRTMAVGVVGGRIVASGGERQPNGASWPQTEEYDPATDSWRTSTPMPTARHGAAAAVVDGRLHVIGGGASGGTSFTRAHEVFTPGTTPPPPPPPPPPPGALAVKVRFATASSTPPSGYLADWGQAFGSRTGATQGSGHSYGWVREGTADPVDLTANARLRTSTATTDPKLLGLMHMDRRSTSTSGTAIPGAWEFTVPDGAYRVTASVGDAGSYYDSLYVLNIEDQNAVADVIPTAGARFRTASRTVQVSDGRLTVNSVEGDNTKINYVEVASLPTSPALPRISTTSPANLQDLVVKDTSITASLALTAGGIDRATLNSTTVRLSDSANGSVISTNVNTSAGGDVIVVTPDAPLADDTRYRFEVTDGVRDVSGNAFQPWSNVFTVGRLSAGTGLTGVAFSKLATPATGQSFTSVTMGPDGKLYAGTLDGYLFRYPVSASGELGAPQRIDTVRTRNGGAPRTIIGMAFDPASTASNLILWITENLQYTGVADVPDWTGKIVELSGSSLSTSRDVVVGLPRSARDHMSNSLAWHGGKLYLTQGSNNAMGAPDSAWQFRAESLLSAAVLTMDPAKLPATLPLDVKTADGGTYDPRATDAAVQLYATGVRNAYDLLWHSNGNLYVPTNGSAAGGNIPGTPTTLPPACQRRVDGAWTGPQTPAVTPNPVDETDWVFRVTANGYYGHPNPARCEWAFNGGNPTSGVDRFEATAYPVGVMPDRNYRIDDVFDAGLHASADGTIEYLSGAFGGALRGKLIVVRYSASQDLMVLDPSGTNGKIVSRTTGVTGFKGFSQPLDIEQHVPSGNLYVTELGGSRITRLVPQ